MQNIIYCVNKMPTLWSSEVNKATLEQAKVAALEIHLSSQQLPRVWPRQTVFLQLPQQKYCRGDYFLAKYIFSLQFLILISQQNFSFTNKRYQLHVLEMCLQVLQELRSTIYFWQFIHPASLMQRSQRMAFGNLTKWRSVAEHIPKNIILFTMKKLIHNQVSILFLFELYSILFSFA